MGAHGHDFAEVFWVEAGTGVHEVGKKRSPLAPGSVTFLRPSDVHNIRAGWSGELAIANVAFAADHLSQITRYQAECGAVASMADGSCVVAPDTVGALGLSFDRLARSALRVLDLHRFLLDVLASIESDRLRHDAAGRVPHWLTSCLAKSRDSPRILAAGVTGLALVAGRSVDHFNRSCRRYLGETASELLNRLRLDLAERLLSTTHLDVSEVAYASGFANLSYFFRLFRRRNQLSPGAYRRKVQLPIRVDGPTRSQSSIE